MYGIRMNIRINMTHVNDTTHSNCVMLVGLFHNYSAHNFVLERVLVVKNLKFKWLKKKKK